MTVRREYSRRSGQVRNRREIPPLRRPTRSQEANAGEKSRPATVGMTVGEGFHPQVQVQARGGKQSFGENLATVVLHAVADLPVVNIQSNVIHRFHGGASLVSLNQRGR